MSGRGRRRWASTPTSSRRTIFTSTCRPGRPRKTGLQRASRWPRHCLRAGPSAGTPRSGDDRRDHLTRACPPDRRPQEKISPPNERDSRRSSCRNATRRIWKRSPNTSSKASELIFVDTVDDVIKALATDLVEKGGRSNAQNARKESGEGQRIGTRDGNRHGVVYNARGLRITLPLTSCA